VQKHVILILFKSTSIVRLHCFFHIFYIKTFIFIPYFYQVLNDDASFNLYELARLTRLTWPADVFMYNRWNHPGVSYVNTEYKSFLLNNSYFEQKQGLNYVMM